MNIVLLLALAALPPAYQDSFAVQADLQGLYDELSEATLACETPLDIDQLHAVLYSPDWVFVDAKKQPHTWEQMRDDAVRALAEGPPLDWMTQTIQKLSPSPDGATVVVNTTTVRTMVDHEGRYGRRDGSHTLTERVTFRDQWVSSADGWKLKSREQVGAPAVSVDKAPSSQQYNRTYHVIG